MKQAFYFDEGCQESIESLAREETVGALTSSDRKGPNSQYVGQDKLIVEFIMRGIAMAAGY